MKQIIPVIQIIVSIFLIISIILQGRGAGLGTSFGGGGEFYSTKRGMERLLFIISLILVFLFLLSSVVNLLVS